jgi:hypothetical protein
MLVSDERSHLTTELAKAYKLLSEREEDLRLAARNTFLSFFLSFLSFHRVHHMMSCIG